MGILAQCIVVIDGGSCENIISQSLVDRLKLKARKHYRPYFVKWFMTGDKVQVRHTCQVTFTISEDYKDTVWCDVLPMNSGNILLERPWMYGKNGTHGMRGNTYMFAHKGKEVTLRPKKPAPPKKGLSTPCLQRQYEGDLSSRTNSDAE